MPVDRPTFSESWYRVAELRPRLRATIQVHRQHYRGQTWYVLQDPSSNQFSRLNEAGYYFLGLLDGRRTVGEVWHAANEMLGDSAPTQGEAIQLLGQLYMSNLLQAELPPDAEGLFGRYKKRRTREVQGYLMNLMFIRIPLIDPEHFLNRWVGVFGRVFTWYGFMVWVAVIASGFYSLAGRWGNLLNSAQNVLDPEKLPLLYLSFMFIKVFHEFGHGFACKRFGVVSGTGGEVHTMGIMMLVFTPVPYVDASSAWAFRKKSHRVMVGMAGMVIELAIAAIAAIVWANTGEGTTIHTIAYNIMFIASVSTLLFNGNPLLRYDAYYILSDLIEIPNLSHRSKQYLYYLVRRYVWGVKRARNPAHTGGEKAWFVFYGLASTFYRIFICVRILLFIADKLFMVGLVLACLAVVAWVLTPLGKFARYLATSGELARVRGRAILTTLVFFGGLFGSLGMIPVPDRFKIEGVVDPIEREVVYAREDGFVAEVLPSGTYVTSLEEADEQQANEALAALRAELADLQARRQAVAAEEQAASAPAAPVSKPKTKPAPPAAARLAKLDKQIHDVQAQINRLVRSFQPVLRATNRDLEAEGKMLAAQLTGYQARRRIAMSEGNMAALQVLDRQIDALNKRIGRNGEQIERLKLRPQEACGTWIAPDIDRAVGSYVRRGERIGLVASLDSLRIRAVVDQNTPRPKDGDRVEIRLKGRPDDFFTGTVEKADKAAKVDLPSPALGFPAGGSVQTNMEDRRGLTAAERFFEIRVKPDSPLPPLTGGRVMVRFDTEPKPVLVQAWRSLLQMIQKRFQI